MSDKFMTAEEWASLSAESRHKINMEFQQLVARAEKSEDKLAALRKMLTLCGEMLDEAIEMCEKGGEE